jgi:ribosomal protein S18 acetylase RimI-like enzyme
MNYVDSVEGITSAQLQGFFVGWPNPPQPEQHLTLLQQSSHIVIAQTDDGQVVGFVTAISDGVVAAHIPLLEVLPDFQRQGVGSQLVKRILANLHAYYSVDLVCDSPLGSFYERLGFARYLGMVIRRPFGMESS